MWHDNNASKKSCNSLTFINIMFNQILSMGILNKFRPIVMKSM